jgi:toxin YoeB
VSRELVVMPAARADLVWWQRSYPGRADRVRRLVGAVLIDPFRGIGKPEPLRGLPDPWSRRITGEHRLVYRAFDDRVEILAARLHYGK